MRDPQSYQSSERHPGHETTDANTRPIALLLVALATLVFLAMLLMAWLLDLFQLRPDQNLNVPAGLTDQEQVPPEPRLQAYPVVDLEKLRVREEQQLNSYEWIDEAAGVMRIPIERAMDIIAENGLPTRPQGTRKGDEGKPLG